MTEEEYFRKNYPNYCYGFEKSPLSPYWDLFEDGVEFGERQSEKKIEELKAELTKKADTNHSLVEQMADLESKNAELKEKNRQLNNEVEDLTAYRNQIGKIKTDVLKLFEHIVAR